MKKILLPIVFLLFFSALIADQPIDSTIIQSSQANIDANFFKHEIQESVLEFISDLGLDPDSCYIPFKNEI